MSVRMTCSWVAVSSVKTSGQVGSAAHVPTGEHRAEVETFCELHQDLWTTPICNPQQWKWQESVTVLFSNNTSTRGSVSAHTAELREAEA